MTDEHAAASASVASERSALPIFLPLVALAVLAYAGWLGLGTRRAPDPFGPWSDANQLAPGPRAPIAPPSEEGLAVADTVPVGPAEDEEDDEDDAPRDRAPGSALPRTQPTAQAAVRIGKVLPYIDSARGVAVGADQGLLVVEASPAGAATRVRVAGRDLGPPPIAIALAVGRYEVVTQRGRDASFRYVLVGKGETRILDAR